VLIGFKEMRKHLIVLATIISAVVLFSPRVRAHNDVNDFVINDFHANYKLFNDVNGGRATVSEKLQINFSSQNRGILRAIPIDYQEKPVKLNIKSVLRDGVSEPYSIYRQANNEVLKIGNANKTITGNHIYEIQYEMTNIISFHNNFDEWYWDINGDQWQQQFLKVSGEVELPNGWDAGELPDASCYTGSFGEHASACNISKTSSGYTFSSTKPLNANETLTVAVPLKKGIFTPRTRTDLYRENRKQLVGVGVGLLLSLIIFLLWLKWGRDYRGRGVIVPEYQPPKNLAPAEVGMLYDYRVDGRDLTATIIDLAIRGYIKIHDDSFKLLGIFKKRRFSLELVKVDISKIKLYEKLLLEGIFDPYVTGTKIEIAKIDKQKMYSSVIDVRSQIKNSLIKKYGLIEKSPIIPIIAMWGIAIVAFILAKSKGLDWGWVVGAFLTIGTATILSSLMSRRSHAGVEMLEKIDGLKLFMDTAEKDRLKMMQSIDRPYAEPSKTVYLFEELLPFAIALGVEKSWAKQFENIYKQPPEWYGGNISNFNAMTFTSSVASGLSSINTNFTKSTSSSSSGSGGGGFAGGGGGGGGGGGW